MKTKTLVKFLVNTEDLTCPGQPGSIPNYDLFAYFPQLNYNKRLYGNQVKTGYVHIGQHTSVHVDYAKASRMATATEYSDLLRELVSIGYTNLKVLNK